MALSALAFTGCMNNDSGEWKKQQQVMPGISIYNSTIMQQNVSMQMAGAGLRLASLLAEARQQYPDTPLEDIDLDKLKVKLDKSEYTLKILLFGPGSKVEKSGAGEHASWLITYGEGTQQADGYILEGSLKVVTGETELLEESSYPYKAWTVELQPDFEIKAVSRDGYGSTVQTTIQMKGGQTKIGRVAEDAAMTGTDGVKTNYKIILDGIRANFENTDGKEYVSSWNGELTLTPEESESVAFSKIWDGDLGVEGQAWGPSIYANGAGTASAGLRYTVQDGVYNFFSGVASNSVGVYAQIVEGSQICEFMQVGDYDSMLFPSPKVEYKWMYEGGRMSCTVFYNGFSYSL